MEPDAARTSTIHLIQWSLNFKTTCSATKIWSYIEGGLEMKGYLHIKSGVTMVTDSLKTDES